MGREVGEWVRGNRIFDSVAWFRDCHLSSYTSSGNPFFTNSLPLPLSHYHFLLPIKLNQLIRHKILWILSNMFQNNQSILHSIMKVM